MLLTTTIGGKRHEFKRNRRSQGARAWLGDFTWDIGWAGGAGRVLGAPATYRWKEEVRLHDGRLIVVERSRVMSGPREPFRSASVGKWTLAFENPDKPGKKISLDVHGGAVPMLLGFVGSVPYVAINPRRGDARRFYDSIRLTSSFAMTTSGCASS